MHTYFLADTAHEDYNNLVAQQKAIFDALKGATNHVMMVNLAGTQAFNQIFGELCKSGAIINNNFNPDSRNMAEWEEPSLI